MKNHEYPLNEEQGKLTIEVPVILELRVPVEVYCKDYRIWMDNERLNYHDAWANPSIWQWNSKHFISERIQDQIYKHGIKALEGYYIKVLD